MAREKKLQVDHKRNYESLQESLETYKNYIIIDESKDAEIDTPLSILDVVLKPFNDVILNLYDICIDGNLSNPDKQKLADENIQALMDLNLWINPK